MLAVAKTSSQWERRKTACISRIPSQEAETTLAILSRKALTRAKQVFTALFGKLGELIGSLAATATKVGNQEAVARRNAWGHTAVPEI